MTPDVGELLGRLGWSGSVVLGAYLLMAAAVAFDGLVVVERVEEVRGAARRAAVLVVTVAGALVAAVPMSLAVAVLWSGAGRLAPAPVVDWWAGHRAAELVVCFLAWDLAAYAYHRMGHDTRVGWASHRVHHLGRTYDMGLVLRQPWFPVHGLVVLPWLAVAGFSFETAAICSALSIGYQAMQHTSREWTWPPPLEAVLVSGRAHRHHHVLDGGAVNLGAVLSVWDRLFGTHRPGVVAGEPEFGVGSPEPLDPLRIQLDGWRFLRRPARRSSPTPSRTHDGSVRHPGGEELNHGVGEAGYQAMVPASCSAATSSAAKPSSVSTDSVSTPG